MDWILCCRYTNNAVETEYTIENIGNYREYLFCIEKDNAIYASHIMPNDVVSSGKYITLKYNENIFIQYRVPSNNTICIYTSAGYWIRCYVRT